MVKSVWLTCNRRSREELICFVTVKYIYKHCIVHLSLLLTHKTSFITKHCTNLWIKNTIICFD